MLKGLRFHQRLKLLPGWREGETTPEPPPGPGLITRPRRKPRGSSTWIGVAALVAGLAFAGWQNRDGIAGWFTAPPSPVLAAAPAPAAPVPPTPSSSEVVTDTPARKPMTIAGQRARLLVPGGVIWVRRGGSVLREAQKPSAKALDKLPKGAAVTVVALEGPWTQVKAGETVGWMRTSVLGPKP